MANWTKGKNMFVVIGMFFASLFLFTSCGPNISKKVRVGMSQTEVRSLCGSPHKVIRCNILASKSPKIGRALPGLSRYLIRGHQRLRNFCHRPGGHIPITFLTSDAQGLPINPDYDAGNCFAFRLETDLLPYLKFT